ncbi:hypothetical protein [uncultured Friedmanniella sp.]|uniref:hypothetical protein n=1 Tax=uncultured Friedmanniella sp. TaxID=335381 RepID=UPI0035CCA3DC
MRRVLALAIASALLFCGLAGSSATATPGKGTTPTNDTTGTLAGPTTAAQDGVTLRTQGATKVRSFTLTYGAGAYSGWHQHPGIVVATVVSGTIVQQVGCRERHTWTAGQSFTEVAPHYVRNFYRTGDPDAVPAVLAITQIYPADAAAVREDLPAPSCS